MFPLFLFTLPPPPPPLSFLLSSSSLSLYPFSFSLPFLLFVFGPPLLRFFVVVVVLGVRDVLRTLVLQPPIFSLKRGRKDSWY